MNTAVMFSTGKDDWETPQDLFDKLDEEFQFDLDVAANSENTKCEWWLTDALNESWLGYRCWCNPPYSRGLQAKFIAKAHEERLKGTLTVMLLPARTDTKAFHKYIYNQPGVEIRFLKGRLRFVGAPASAPFPSMIVIFRP